MKSPYQILGVDPNASDEEIKTAYRNLARKYHPDKYRDSDLAEMAEEKMKEINAAYEQIQEMRAGRQGSGSTGYDPNQYGSDSYQGSSYGSYTQGQNSTPFYIQVRQLINARRIAEAENMLLSVPEADRNAEWHFLMGTVCVNRGFYADAGHYFNTACAMDPNNAEYRNAKQQFSQARGNGYGTGSAPAPSCSICDICAALACLDCLCDCF